MSNQPNQKPDDSPWNEKAAEVLIKAIPVLLGSGAGGLISLISTSELPKIALGAGIGGAGTLGYALVAPSFKKAKKGADQVGEAGATAIEHTVQEAIAGVTGAEAKYLEAQRLDCRTDRCQGFGADFRPLLKEIYVPLSVGDRSILPGWSDSWSGDRQAMPAAMPAAMGPAEQAQNPKHLFIWDLLKLAEQEPRLRRMAILAWGGYGKTTLMRHLAYIYASQEQSSHGVQFRVPMLLFLGELWTKFLAKQEAEDLTLPDLADVIHDYHIPEFPKSDEIKLPNNWAKKKLKQGNTIVLLDGFDEVPQSKRPTLARWIDEQTQEYDKSIFIVTSRPKAYQTEAKADRIALRSIWVEPFDEPQQRQFVSQWYFYREIYANNGRTDADVEKMAERSAEALLTQIQERPEIQDLAKIPLLLNMIATVDREGRGARLPKRKVKLYQRICDLQLQDRLDAKDLDTQLLNVDAQKILQRLALEMLLNDREKTIDKTTLLKRLETYLKAENETLEAKKFLEDIVNISELLVEKDADSYEFSHLSFQEYLAAREIWQEQQESLLYEKFGEKEWKPAILLYVAQVRNPSHLIQAMLERGQGDLAYECFQETTKQINPALQQSIKALKPAVQTSRYAELERLLAAQEWLKADEETYRLMITTVGKEEGQWFDPKDFETFPCEDLRTIDGLWVNYSQRAGREYGFSVQKRIWEDCGSPRDYDGWCKFGDRIAWRKKGKWVTSASDLYLNRPGVLPWWQGEDLECQLAGVVWGGVSILFSRAKTCRL